MLNHWVQSWLIIPPFWYKAGSYTHLSPLQPLYSLCLQATTHTCTHTKPALILKSPQQCIKKKKGLWWTWVPCCIVSEIVCLWLFRAAEERNSVVINVSLITKISKWLVFVICPRPEDEEHGPGGAERRPQVAAGCDLAGSGRQQKQLCGVQQR